MQTKDLKELKKKLLPYLVEAKWIGLDNHCLPKKFHDTVYLFQDGKVLIQLIDHAIQSAIERERKRISDLFDKYNDIDNNAVQFELRIRKVREFLSELSKK